MKNLVLTAAALTAIAAPGFAQQNSQLAQSLEHQLAAEGIYDVDVYGLSVADQAAIKALLDTDDETVGVESHVRAILR